ncbi:MAG TPA: NUDIX domain-containing protein [Candidatus Sulfopaludibacter sp.]|jgi:bis(5'-nucleosidyl)-tetraphosphatase|nr:NUDIX domain-containing protein [Candidatus Sulfopaludibacter sp.]
MYDEISAGAVLHVMDKNFEINYLILNYSYGHWDFPKGNIESGETEIETIKREVMEETGIIDITLIEGFRQQISYKYRKKSKLINKTVIYYLAETKSNKVVLSFEHVNFAWLNFKDAMDKLSFDNSKRVLKNAKEFLSNNIKSY